MDGFNEFEAICRAIDPLHDLSKIYWVQDFNLRTAKYRKDVSADTLNDLEARMKETAAKMKAQQDEISRVLKPYDDKRSRLTRQLKAWEDEQHQTMYHSLAQHGWKSEECREAVRQHLIKTELGLLSAKQEGILDKIRKGTISEEIYKELVKIFS